MYKQQYDNDSIEDGVPFYPLAAFRNKLLLSWFTAWVIITSSIYGFFGFIALMASFDNDPTDSQFGEWIQTHIPNLVGGYFLISIALVIPIVLLTIFYVRSIEFRLEDTEIIVKKGIINKMEKHIPFRTITNVSSRYGIYDRFFRIGTVQIETAGRSGQQTGPEAKIEGIKNFFEVRDIILNRLRKFRGSYTTTTEIETPTIETVPSEGHFYKDMLSELREIKEILSK